MDNLFELNIAAAVGLAVPINAQSIEINTAARTWWEHNPVSVTIPPHHYFWWLRTRNTWVWHPGIGQSPPEGNGEADHHFVFKRPCRAGGLTGYARVHNNKSFFCIYLPKFNQSVGENGVFYRYMNDNDHPLAWKFFCNDHDDDDMYADNSGVIVHTIAWAPM